LKVKFLGSGHLDILQKHSYQQSTKAIGRLAPYCAVALISILVLTQTPAAYSIEVFAQGANTENRCSASNSDFEAGLKRLAETVTDRAEIPPEFLQKYFAGCTIEAGAEFLARSGFDTGASASAFDDKEAGITRKMLGEKMMQRFGPLVSLICRIGLRNYASNELRVFGFFYFDGP
jgi:hypothetical protein